MVGRDARGSNRVQGLQTDRRDAQHAVGRHLNLDTVGRVSAGEQVQRRLHHERRGARNDDRFVRVALLELDVLAAPVPDEPDRVPGRVHEVGARLAPRIGPDEVEESR